MIKSRPTGGFLLPGKHSFVTMQTAPYVFEDKAKTRSVLLHMSIFNAGIGQIRG